MRMQIKLEKYHITSRKKKAINECTNVKKEKEREREREREREKRRITQTKENCSDNTCEYYSREASRDGKREALTRLALTFTESP